MIIHGCIEIHLKACVGWIIEMRFRVLLITHYLIQEILVKTIFDVCHNLFLGSSQLHFLFFKKKKTRNNVILILFSFFPVHAETRKKKILNLFFPAILLLFPLLTCPKTQATSHTLPPLMQAMIGHPPLCQDVHW